MPQRPRILLLIPHLGGGGAEKVISLLAQGLPADKYEIHLGLVTQHDLDLAELSPGVTAYRLGAHRVRYAAARILKLIWRVKPAVVLSGIAHLNFLVLMLKPLLPRGTKLMIRQNSTASRSLAVDRLPVYTRFLYRSLYRHAHRIICPTNAMAEDLATVAGIDEKLIAVLPNPLDHENIKAARSAQPRWNSSGPNLLAIGRLSPEKGFDLLIEAMKSVSQKFPSARLMILGTGPEEATLKARCSELDLDRFVTFAGYEKMPYSYYPGTTLFVLPSRHEGMPNALLEAFSAGLPLVATPASGGIVELLQDHPQSWIVPEISSAALSTTLVQAIRQLLPLCPE
jgi:glycosyltransferase involved in cell wall biosynthesis